MDENLWVALSFVVFVALVWKKASGALSSMLDGRTAEIKKNLDEARRLRDEAQAELQKYQRLNREAKDQAQQIVNNAEAAADKIRENAAAALEQLIARKEEQATVKIKTMEAEAVAELRNRAADLTSAAAAELIKTHLDPKHSAQLVAGDIEQIKKIG